THDQAGRVPAANGGTLFLDEVGELPLSIQAKLLRFLESGECQPVGQARTECLDVRVIAASNCDLLAAVQAGTFREDLYYRLNVVPLHLPPLRERGKDIELLVSRLTSLLTIQHCLDAPRYNMAALEAMQASSWPGNVRELRNVCERMLILFSGKTIHPENLPAEIRYNEAQADSPSFALPESGIQLEQLEVSMIQQALDKSRGNQSKAARLLGLSRGTLIYRMKKYALA
ncbi:MAG: sigma-54-dependent Fis family transcriptional regulator, partial [Halobacteria archaeon]|nr:sigma-54-dependent Fis family transcriptional regulator [Halobacteria archaeon]